MTSTPEYTPQPRTMMTDASPAACKSVQGDHLATFHLSTIEAALLTASTDSASSGIHAVLLDDIVPGGNALATTAADSNNKTDKSLRPPLPPTSPYQAAAAPGVEQRQIFVGQLPVFIDADWVVPLLNHARRLTTAGSSTAGAAVSSAVRRSSGARASPYALVTLETVDDVASFRSMHRCVYLGQRYMFYCHAGSATQQTAPPPPPPVADEGSNKGGRRKAAVDLTTTPLHELVSALTAADGDAEAPETRARGLARACVVIGPANPPPPPPPPQPLKPASAAPTKPAAAAADVGGRRRGGRAAVDPRGSALQGAAVRAPFHGHQPPAYAHQHQHQHQHQQHHCAMLPPQPSPLSTYQPPPPTLPPHRQHPPQQWFATSTPPPPPGAGGAVAQAPPLVFHSHQHPQYEHQQQGTGQAQQPSYAYVSIPAPAPPTGVSLQVPYHHHHPQQLPPGFATPAYPPQIGGEGTLSANHAAPPPQQQQLFQQDGYPPSHLHQQVDPRGFVAMMPVAFASQPHQPQLQPPPR